jgi:hypothetical protein
MTQTPAVPEGNGVRKTPSFGRSASLLFWIVVCIPLAMILFSFFLASNPAVAKYGDDIRIASQRVVFESRNRSCDVVLFGDSTAQTGFDPAVTQQATHMSVCNVAISGAALGALGIDPLDRFLNANARPKLLILQFSGGNMFPKPNRTVHSENADGYILYLSYYPLRPALIRAIQYPGYITSILKYVFLYRGRQLARELSHWSGQPDPNQAFLRSIQPPLKSCPPELPASPSVDRAWVQYLRSHFAPRADRVLINVAPTTSCNQDRDHWKAELNGLIDNHVNVLPLSYFVSDAHFSSAGITWLSGNTAQEILRAEQEPHAANAAIK